MGLIGSILLATSGVVAAILVATLSRLLADDFKAWVPRLTGHAIQRAVRSLPEDQRDRLAEQWAADVADIPGDLGKLVFACDLIRASVRIARDDRRRQISEARPNAMVVNPPSGVITITLGKPVPKAPLTDQRIAEKVQRALEPWKGVARESYHSNRLRIEVRDRNNKLVLQPAEFRLDILRNEHQLDKVLAEIRDQVPPAATSSAL